MRRKKKNSLRDIRDTRIVGVLMMILANEMIDIMSEQRHLNNPESVSSVYWRLLPVFWQLLDSWFVSPPFCSPVFH